jgi:hypothetical protein
MRPANQALPTLQATTSRLSSKPRRNAGSKTGKNRLRQSSDLVNPNMARILRTKEDLDVIAADRKKTSLHNLRGTIYLPSFCSRLALQTDIR